jgi:hypothetical protein
LQNKDFNGQLKMMTVFIIIFSATDGPNMMMLAGVGVIIIGVILYLWKFVLVTSPVGGK